MKPPSAQNLKNQDSRSNAQKSFDGIMALYRRGYFLSECYPPPWYHKELSRRHARAKRVLCKSGHAVSSFALQKIRELEQEWSEEMSYRDSLARRLAQEPGASDWFVELCIERSGTRLNAIDERLTHFKALHRACRKEPAAPAPGSEAPPPRAPPPSIDIEEIKAIAPEVLLGAPQQKYGGRLRWRCPLHGERTPSFFWFLKSRTFKCFGCGAHGSIIDLCMMLESLSLKDAIKHLSTYV